MSTPTRFTTANGSSLHLHTPVDRVKELLLQLQQPTPQRSGQQNQPPPRMTPVQFRRPQQQPPIESSDEEDDDDGQSYEESEGSNPSDSDDVVADDLDGSSEDESASHRLDQSGDIDQAELQQLLARASQLTGLLSPTSKAKQRANANNTRASDNRPQQPQSQQQQVTNASASEDDADPNIALTNAALQSKIASERAVLGELITKLSALQTQASQLKTMSEMSRRAHEEMKELMAGSDANVAELEKEKQALQQELDKIQDGFEDFDSGNESEDQVETEDPNRSRDLYTSASPSDSELEVEIEHSRDQQSPDESDDDLPTSRRQLAELEALMSQLAQVAEEQKKAVKQGMTLEEQEREEEEEEVDQRLFFGGGEKDQKKEQRGSSSSAATDAAAYNRYISQLVNSNKSSSSHPSSSSHARPSTSPASTSSPTSLAVPVNAVPAVPISRWIGPSTLPPQQGGSGRHAVYNERPATAVGTTRGAVRGGGGGGGGESSSASSHSSSASWQPPTLTALSYNQNKGQHPHPHSSSSRSSLVVNAPSESEVSSEYSRDRRYENLLAERRANGILLEDSAEDEDDDEDQDENGYSENELPADHRNSLDDDYVVIVDAKNVPHLRNAQQPPIRHHDRSPSDSDSELPYAINATSSSSYPRSATSTDLGPRPKTARKDAPSQYLNGHRMNPTTQQASSSNYSQAAHPSQQKSYSRSSNTNQYSPRSLSPSESSDVAGGAPLSSADFELMLAFIGSSLYRSTINVGNTGVRSTSGTGAQTQLGAGRLGASQVQRQQVNGEREAQPVRMRQSKSDRRAYGFQPAMPTRAWQ